MLAARRVALRSSDALARRVLARPLAIDSQLSERERALEAVYFQKEEKELLKKIAKKMGMPSKETALSEEAELKKIFAKHAVDAKPALVQDLMTYFHTHPH
ncbi:hypothetical protein KFE25_013065 [Diacronema lutheri]|uniref:Uncharacterized protein n=2 Tax=Diacronema lutheri TaxID=2081491 RepID=A0A8J6C3L8_DIALT|nr:hypothetical protein KFE25_013065 [Diacronema lutheri]